jgi:prolyl-tRNA synthetase
MTFLLLRTRNIAKFFYKLPIHSYLRMIGLHERSVFVYNCMHGNTGSFLPRKQFISKVIFTHSVVAKTTTKQKRLIHIRLKKEGIDDL